MVVETSCRWLLYRQCCRLAICAIQWLCDELWWSSIHINVLEIFPNDNSGGFELRTIQAKQVPLLLDKVGKAIEKASGEQPWQGMFTDLESYMTFDKNLQLKMKVLSPKSWCRYIKSWKTISSRIPAAQVTILLPIPKQVNGKSWLMIFQHHLHQSIQQGNMLGITLIWDIVN